ncbi:MAG: GvpL/GvpF family gas vesicle protein, partial [Pseudomonadota bacterium]
MADVDTEDDARYVYGVIAAADAPRAAAHLAKVTGVAAAPPTVLMLGSVAAVVSAHPGGPLRRTRRHMLAHTQVLEAICAEVTTLPMRFGLIATSEAALSARIAAHRPRLEEALVRFDGLVEAGVSIHAPRAAAFAAMVKEAPDLAARHAALAARGADAHYERIDFGRHVAEALDRRRKRA